MQSSLLPITKNLSLVTAFSGLFLSALSSHAAITPGSKNIGAVWFIGDSITQGDADRDGTSGMRDKTFDLLTAGGYTFTSTGGHTANPEGITDPALRLHSGFSGSTIEAYTGTPRVNMTTELATEWANGVIVNPNVIIIMLGTNDMAINYDVANAPARLTNLIQMIYDFPGIGNPTVLLSTIAPNFTNNVGVGVDLRVDAFNATLPGVVSSFVSSGKDIQLVDNHASLTITTFADYLNLYADPVHPNANGNQRIAQNYFDAIDSRVNAVPEVHASLLLAASSLALLRRRCR